MGANVALTTEGCYIKEIGGHEKCVSAALLITAMMIPAISGCTTQGTPAPDAVHQIEDDSSAVYDDDPIAVEPQLDEDELDGDSDESNVQGEIISAEPHKGSAE